MRYMAELTKRLPWHLDPTSCRELCGASFAGLSEIQIWADVLSVFTGSLATASVLKPSVNRTPSKQSRRCSDCGRTVYRRSSLRPRHIDIAFALRPPRSGGGGVFKFPLSVFPAVPSCLLSSLSRQAVSMPLVEACSSQCIQAEKGASCAESDNRECDKLS